MRVILTLELALFQKATKAGIERACPPRAE